jgi:tetraacyldisaccharide-1-P 4'-kinase
VRGVYDDSDQLKDPGWLRTQRLQPVCGVGNPFSFRLVCDTLADVVRTPLSFADHHRYTRADARVIVSASRQRGVDQVVTTRKDWGKLRAVWPTAGPPLLRVDIATRVLDPNGTLDTALANALKEHQ